jgi:hypothetical protein
MQKQFTKTTYFRFPPHNKKKSKKSQAIIIIWFLEKITAITFSGLFSTPFCQILKFYGHQVFSAMKINLRLALSYLPEFLAIWQQ